MIRIRAGASWFGYMLWVTGIRFDQAADLCDDGFHCGASQGKIKLGRDPVEFCSTALLFVG